MGEAPRTFLKRTQKLGCVGWLLFAASVVTAVTTIVALCFAGWHKFHPGPETPVVQACDYLHTLGADWRLVNIVGAPGQLSQDASFSNLQSDARTFVGLAATAGKRELISEAEDLSQLVASAKAAPSQRDPIGPVEGRLSAVEETCRKLGVDTTWKRETTKPMKSSDLQHCADLETYAQGQLVLPLIRPLQTDFGRLKNLRYWDAVKVQQRRALQFVTEYDEHESVALAKALSHLGSTAVGHGTSAMDLAAAQRSLKRAIRECRKLGYPRIDTQWTPGLLGVTVDYSKQPPVFTVVDSKSPPSPIDTRSPPAVSSCAGTGVGDCVLGDLDAFDYPLVQVETKPPSVRMQFRDGATGRVFRTESYGGGTRDEIVPPNDTHSIRVSVAGGGSWSLALDDMTDHPERLHDKPAHIDHVGSFVFPIAHLSTYHFKHMSQGKFDVFVCYALGPEPTCKPSLATSGRAEGSRSLTIPPSAGPVAIVHVEAAGRWSMTLS